MADERVLNALRDLHRAQAYVVETYDKHSKDERLPIDIRKSISDILQDHYQHRIRIEKAIRELGSEVPSAAATLTGWLSGLKELVAPTAVDYHMIQNDLATEYSLVAAYKVTIELAADYPNVVDACRENMADDEQHIGTFEATALGLARKARKAA
ncbi:MAG: ferritin-like domain-containing protein [Actinobacteria bacterium]|nr:ferritin-like domain-containing protein [Actinomycetota bacterium]